MRFLPIVFAAAGKPEKIVDKIVAGRLDKYYGDVCLLEQAFIMDADLKVKNNV